MSSRVPQESLSTRLVAAGNRLHIAETEADKHAAAVELLRLRLVYFTGHEDGPFRGVEVDEVCAKLTSREVRAITDYCWASYQGGMTSMKESFDARSKR